MAKIAVLGYGTVGSGVVDVLTMNKDLITQRTGEEIEVKYILDLKEFPGTPIEKLIVHDVDTIINDPEIDVIVETMGGEEPAHTFVKRALENGKSVCSSNKAIIAAFGAELIKIAKEKKVRFLFDAAVAGGIPIIRPIKEALTADRIDGISGILNGTTNYILTKMSKEGAEFEVALKEAQDNGYAERDPGADIEGFDSCRKIAILASLITGKNVPFEEIYTEGIVNITATDFKYAEVLGRKIKLLARFMFEDGKLRAMTAPFIVDPTHPLFNVDGVINGVCIQGNAVGELVFQGAGAGKYPTASAVAADVVDAVKNKDVTYRLLWDDTQLTPEAIEENYFRYFVRVKNTEGIKEKISTAFGKVEFVEIDGDNEEFGFITQETLEKDFLELRSLIDAISSIRIVPDEF